MPRNRFDNHSKKTKAARAGPSPLDGFEGSRGEKTRPSTSGRVVSPSLGGTPISAMRSSRTTDDGRDERSGARDGADDVADQAASSPKPATDVTGLSASAEPEAAENEEDQYDNHNYPEHVGALPDS